MGNDIDIKRDKKGNIVGASLQIDEKKYRLNIKRGIYNEGTDNKMFHFSELEFFEDGNRYASVKGIFSDPMELFRLEVDTTDKRLHVTQDYSGKKNTSEGGSLITTLNENILKGSIAITDLDKPTIEYEDSDRTRGLMLPNNLLQPEIMDKINYFEPIFNEFESKLKQNIEITREGGFPTGKRIRDIGIEMEPSESDTERGWAGYLGRAGCWAAGGVVAAGACAGTFGVGCVLGAAAGGAAASVCSDIWSKADPA
jgi:hypothetical protein